MRFSSGALLIGSDVGSRLTSVRSRISLASLREVQRSGFCFWASARRAKRQKLLCPSLQMQSGLSCSSSSSKRPMWLLIDELATSLDP